MTFTPLAIDQDPIGVKKKIKEIHQHPFWACYILPTALGMTVKLEAGSADPVDLFQKLVPSSFHFLVELTYTAEENLCVVISQKL